MLYFLYFESTDLIEISRCCCNREYPFLKIPRTEFYKMMETDELKKYLVSINQTKSGHCSKFKTNDCRWDKDNIRVSFQKACNLKCPFCYVRSGHKDSPVRKKLYFDFIYYIKGLFPESILTLTDFGEPFFYKQEILDFLLSLQPGDFHYVQITTNGSLMTPDIVFKLSQFLKVPLYIDVSIDSLNETLYNANRIGSNIQIVKNNVSALYKMQNKNLKLNAIGGATVSSESKVPIEKYAESLNTKFWHTDMLTEFSDMLYRE